MEKKYEIIQESGIDYNGSHIYAIKALRNFDNVKKGDIGGFIEKEENLSHDGNCWVDRGSIVADNAFVSENAIVGSHSYVGGNARIFGNAIVNCFSTVTDDASVSGDVCVTDRACIDCNADVSGNVIICGNSHIGEHAYIRNQTDYMSITNIGDQRSHLTFYREIDNSIYVCLHNNFNVNYYNIKEFEDFINQINSSNDLDSIKKSVLLNAIKMAKNQFLAGYINEN